MGSEEVIELVLEGGGGGLGRTMKMRSTRMTRMMTGLVRRRWRNDWLG